MRKKIILTIFACSIATIFCGMTMAATITGSDQTITDSTTGYPGLDNIDLSPNVSIGHNIADDSFALGAFNSKGSVQYGVASDSTTVWFDDDVTALTEPTAATSAAFDSYAVLGGS